MNLVKSLAPMKSSQHWARAAESIVSSSHLSDERHMTTAKSIAAEEITLTYQESRANFETLMRQVVNVLKNGGNADEEVNALIGAYNSTSNSAEKMMKKLQRI